MTRLKASSEARSRPSRTCSERIGQGDACKPLRFDQMYKVYYKSLAIALSRWDCQPGTDRMRQFHRILHEHNTAKTIGRKLYLVLRKVRTLDLDSSLVFRVIQGNLCRYSSCLCHGLSYQVEHLAKLFTVPWMIQRTRGLLRTKSMKKYSTVLCENHWVGIYHVTPLGIGPSAAAPSPIQTP